MAQIIGIPVLVLSWSNIEAQYRKAFNKIVSLINDDYDTHKDQCQLMFELSDLFECFGANEPYDFKDSSVVTDQICCKESSMHQKGCGQVTIKWISDNIVDFVMIPVSIILIIEFLTIVTVRFFIFKDRNKNTYN